MKDGDKVKTMRITTLQNVAIIMSITFAIENMMTIILKHILASVSEIILFNPFYTNSSY